MRTHDELRDLIASAIKSERDIRPFPLADAAISAMRAAGLIIGFLVTDDEPSEAGLALVRVIPNE